MFPNPKPLLYWASLLWSVLLWGSLILGGLLWVAVAGASLLHAQTARTGADPLDDLAGRVIGTIGDARIDLPLLKSDYDIDINGDMAMVRLTQVFENPADAPMSAEYLFPLNQHAAVFAMELRVGDEVIAARIRRKAEAEQVFAEAEAEGKAAALLTQHRPNMFTQQVANLMPGLPVTVTLSYVQSVPRIDGAYELVVPLVVGPRYEGAPQVSDVDEPGTERDGWHIAAVPAYPAVFGLDLPELIAPDRVALDLSLTAPVPLVSVTSATHALSLTDRAGGVTATFAQGRVLDNRDFVLRYALGGDAVTAGVMAHKDARGGVLSLMIEPPRVADAADATPRELVFVLDTSGSMGGAPIEASKRFMAAALQGLRPADSFRILSFSNDPRQFNSAALPATAANLRAGLAHVRGLAAGGGTEIERAIRAAFSLPQRPGALRIVVFLSDGYIGDEAGVLATIRQQIGQARIYAFGVGASVNRYLLDGMAREGRGYARYVDPTETAEEAAEALARDLRTPLLTDLRIDWGGLDVTEATPHALPDLFDGSSLRVLARFDTGGTGQVTVSGLVNGRRATFPLSVSLPEAGFASEETGALPLVWARERIADHERDLATRVGQPEELEAAITDLGLTYGLQSRFTSFVAVSERVVNDTGAAATRRAVALPQVAGVPASGYPSQGLAGASTPEPQTWLGMVLLAALAAARLGHRRRA